jgi:muconolactone delta-isomerase
MIFARQSNDSAHNEPSFVRDFHYLTALIRHLGAHERWNSRIPRNYADSLGMYMPEVERLLASYPTFFRRTSNLGSKGEHPSSSSQTKIKG